MKSRMSRAAVSGAVVVAIVALLSGCVGAASAPSPTPSPTAEASTPTPTPTPTPEPPLVISGTVLDEQGGSLAVTIAVMSAEPLTDTDRADFAAARCETDYPSDALLGDPQARVVTMTATAVGADGFTGWSDGRGAEVRGSLFDGPIWERPAHAHTTPCSATSLLARPGTGTVRSFVSAASRGIVGDIPEGSAITLAHYGFGAQRPNAYDQPARVTSITGCTVESSPEIEALAASVPMDEVWGEDPFYPEWCQYGRNSLN
jgi:hypothetical protein